MYIKKWKINCFIIIISLSFILASLAFARVLSWEETNYLYIDNKTAFVDNEISVNSNLDLPFPIPSSLSTENFGLRLDLERIAVNKYYIVYSLIYGDQSHTAYHLYLTDLAKKALNTEQIGDIYLKVKEQIIYPVAQVPVIKDFPEDQPLGWKIKIIVKFPYVTNSDYHSLVLHYHDKELRIENIKY